MRSSCVAAAVLLCGAPHVAAQVAWNSTGGAACENASLAEFSSCVADCHGSCDPSLFAACDVQFPEGSESLRRFTEPAANRLHLAGADTRWAKASRRHSATCARFIFCEQLLLDIGESSECCGDGECDGPETPEACPEDCGEGAETPETADAPEDAEATENAEGAEGENAVDAEGAP